MKLTKNPLFVLVLMVSGVFGSGSAHTFAQQIGNGGPAPFNDLIVQQIHAMPQAGGYSASHLASQRLGDAVTVGRPLGLEVNAAQAQPSYCSGATYLVFLKTMDALARNGTLPPGDRVYQALLVAGQRDGEGIWGRWNANGPGTARLFHEMGLGRNFTDFERAMPGDFMKIFWSPAVGRREHGHSVIFLANEKIGGVDSVRFWSSNLGMGYGEKTVPRSKISAAIFSRLTVPQNIVRAPLLAPAVDPYLARLLTTDSSLAEVREKCGL